MPEPPKILLGVCGGVAAYKSADLVREFQRSGAEVRVMMTRSAQQFIQPLTFASLTGHKVFADLWESPSEASVIEHIAQAQWADAVVIAPATANTIAKLAHGMADDFVTCACLATRAPVFVAPAMNVNMLHHEATQANLAVLQHRGNSILQPGSGYLACGMTGDGRLAEIPAIVHSVLDSIRNQNDLEGETVLITAGGTREPIDPVRYIGNRSSGRMGYALALNARHRGAHVILVSAATSLAPPIGCEVINVGTAQEMHQSVLEHLARATIVIKAAAVADFRVQVAAKSKLHRDGPRTLDLVPTEDIVHSIVQQRRPDTLVIAFAAEMGLDIDRAREKLLRKGADAIVLNDISRPNLGFDSLRNAGVFITADEAVSLPESTKDQLAIKILDQILVLRSRMRTELKLAPSLPCTR